jgi:transcription initiation factor TFIID subunit 2
MDFRTLSDNLKNGHYKTMEAFADDVLLIFKNCRQFNPPGTLPVIGADNVERAFRKEWASLMRNRLTASEKKGLFDFLERLRQMDE